MSTVSNPGDPILFYSQHGEYGEFSNFAPYTITLKGRTWKTTEHYFQAQKFAGTALESKIRNASTPMEAATMGRNRRNKPRHDWERVKDQIMYEAVLAKFSQHPALKTLLLSTGEVGRID